MILHIPFILEGEIAQICVCFFLSNRYMVDGLSVLYTLIQGIPSKVGARGEVQVVIAVTSNWVENTTGKTLILCPCCTGEFFHSLGLIQNTRTTLLESYCRNFRGGKKEVGIYDS